MTLATHQPIGIRNPTLVRAKEAQLLALLRDRPGLRVPQICEATGEAAGAVADRLQRLLRRGEVEKIGREWRLRREDADDDELVIVMPTPEPEPEDPMKWVRPISRYVRTVTNEFACRRFG